MKLPDWFRHPIWTAGGAVKMQGGARLSATELNGMKQAEREFALQNLTRDVRLPRVIGVLERTAQPRGDRG
jgi:hypothetical protein